jgi:hypothetical protein
MKKISKRTLQISLIIIILLVAFNWNRFSGAYTVFRLVDTFSAQIVEDNDDLAFRIDASWGKEEHRTEMAATVNYERDKFFTADIIYGENRYVIKSTDLLTEVDVIKSSLRISSEGSVRENYDVFQMLGEILKDHPATVKVTSLNFFDKSGIAAWVFFKCRFDDNGTYRMITIPKEATGFDIILQINKETDHEIILQAGDAENLISLSILWESFERLPDRSGFLPESEILVDRTELNRAVYRGTLRAAGILLENAIKPEIDTTDVQTEHGLLTFVNQNRVLLAEGSPSEIGTVHGTLLKKEIRKMIDATLYTVGWAYTIERKRWFIEDMRGAYARLEPFIPAKYQEEMTALAKSTDFPLEEIRLTNVFPELFHCSGFALFGEATVDGKLLHGRVLDYMTGIGLQHHAVVFAIHPQGGNAFVNVGYAGFIGSVSGMNDKQVAFGEMGGRGEGDWDGMPMAFLMRDGLERADSLDEALAIFRDTPRTCEYFYVISDGKIPDARGLSTTPERFEIIQPNQFLVQLPHPQKDAVLMSAGDRYEKLAERVKENFGKFDIQQAIHLMDRPVAMKSNLHNVLFAPQTMEFWVANAGADTPAANELYTYYNFKSLFALLD